MLWRYRKVLSAIVSFLVGVGLQISGIEIPWLGYSFMVFGVILFMYYLYTVYKDRALVVDSKTDSSVVSRRNRSSILRIKQRELPSRPPNIFNIILIFSHLLILAFGVYGLYMWIAGKTSEEIDWAWIGFIVFFIVYPSFTLLDILFFERKYYRLGRSRVAKDAEIVLKGEINSVFNTCLSVIERMKAKIVIQNSPKLIKAVLGSSKITVELKRRRSSYIYIYVLSDSHWVTVKFDIKSTNQRNVDSFKQFLAEELAIGEGESFYSG